jgi:dolichyl-phosphate-mannose-protein mannosyltransferase
VTIETPPTAPQPVPPARNRRSAQLETVRSSISNLLPGPHQLLVVLLVAAALLRVVWLDVPDNSLIFDEAYYVNASRVMVGQPVAADAPYAGQPVGIDPNQEHPPLGKVLIAGSMSMLGDTPLGWRLPSLVAGLASLLLLFGIVRAGGGEAWYGLLAATLLALDNLAFVHSRIATLDMPLTALLLLAAWCTLRGWFVPAGVASGLAALVKFSALYGLAGLLIFLLADLAWHWRTSGVLLLKRVITAAGVLIVVFLVTWFGGLWLLDRQWSTFTTPWEHISYIVTYGLALAREHGPANSESAPWQWLVNDVAIPYLRVDSQLMVNGELTETRSLVDFRGAMNPLIIGAAPLAVGFTAWQWWRTGDRLSLWTIAWIVGTYLPYYPLVLLQHRITYLFYFLPTLPAVVVAIAALLRRSGLPPAATWLYGLTVLVGFIVYFPFRQAG